MIEQHLQAIEATAYRLRREVTGQRQARILILHEHKRLQQLVSELEDQIYETYKR